MKKVTNYFVYHFNQFVNCFLIRDYVKWLRIEKELSLKDKHYVLLTIRQFPLIMIQEIFIGVLLARRGATVTMILDNGFLKHWDTFMVTQGLDINSLNPLRSKGIRFYERKLKSFLLNNAAKIAGIDIVFIESNKNTGIAKISNNILSEYSSDVNFAIKESSYRYFQTEFLDGKVDSDIYSKHSIFNIETIIRTFVVLNNSKTIDCIITSHGFLSCWKPALIMSKYLKCGLRVYGQNGHSNGKVLVMDRPHNFFGVDVLPKKLELVLLNDSHIDKRINKELTLDSSVYYSDKKVKVELSRSKFTIGIFPGIIWDMNTPERNTIFGGVSDWVIWMVEIAKKYDFQLVVRFHPAESTMFKGFGSLKHILIEKYGPSLFNDVIVIDNNVSVDSHEFSARNLDAALVYDGILGIELPSIGVNTIMCAKGRFNHNDINITPCSIQELEKLLLSLSLNNNLLRPDAKSYANLFLNTYIEDYSYDMPIFSNKELLKIELGSGNRERLRNSSLLDKFIQPFLI